MPSTSSPESERRARVMRLEALSKRLDTRYRIPVLGIPFGWDSIIGLIPVFGDAVTALPSVAMIYEGHRMGARKRVLARMGGNTALDALMGGIPVVGDLFDLLFKSHRKNIRLLMAELDRVETSERNQRHGRPT
tara:strand:+ start:47083 stop:47484 length:402 start_codon:yes stop_codon:yes gene_type:complete